MIRLATLVLLLSAWLAFATALTVHLQCHTHDDVGWLKTISQYHFGFKNKEFQEAAVTHILTSVMAALKRVPERRFSYVEQAFFMRWWRQQNDAMKADVRKFVANGQLEFLNGGWSMHDEATSHVIDMIDSTTLGHQHILTEFGEAANPKSTWSIDPFGHSATNAAVLAYQAGMESLWFGRLDYQDYARRVKEKTMQLVWQGSRSLGPDYQTWTEIALDGNYNPYPGGCWDDKCNDAPVQDDPTLNDYNLDQQVDNFIRQANAYAATRQGDISTMNIAFNQGSDFMYENAERFFINMDKIIKGVNANGTMKVLYSTPHTYYLAKLAEKQVWPLKTDDFFPLVNDPQNAWTGYFSSRVGFKGYVRSSSILLQTARQLEVFTGGDGTGTERLWESLGVAQHHDSVSGTARQHVSDDYSRLIAIGAQYAYDTLDAALTKLVNNGLQFKSCPRLNISECAPIATASKGYTVTLWNPDAHGVELTVSLPVYTNDAVRVRFSGSDSEIESVMTKGVQNQAWNNMSAPNLITFVASLPPLGYQAFDVFVPSMPAPSLESSKTRATLRATSSSAIEIASHQTPQDVSVTISNKFVQLTFDNTTGLLVSWTDRATGVVHKFSQQFYYYRSSNDTNVGSSSSYMFSPANNTGIFSLSVTPTLRVIETPLYSSVVQTWNSWVQQEVRLDALTSGAFVDFKWTIGSVDIEDGWGKDVITRYETDIASKSTFYTDANGLELQQRVLDQRPSFNWTKVAPIATNYYPTTALAGIRDDTTSLYVLNDRAQGATSLQDGNLEFMIHRRLLCGCGFSEPLNETDSIVYPSLERLGPGLIVSGVHRVILGTNSAAIDLARLQQQALYRPIHPVFAPLPTSAVSADDAALAPADTKLSFIAGTLPAGVFMQTLQVLFDGSILIRFSHAFAIKESATYSSAVTFDLSTLFVQPLTSIKQMSLTANSDYKNRAERKQRRAMSARVMSDEEEAYAEMLDRNLDDTMVTIYPMQILSFKIAF